MLFTNILYVASGIESSAKVAMNVMHEVASQIGKYISYFVM